MKKVGHLKQTNFKISMIVTPNTNGPVVIPFFKPFLNTRASKGKVSAAKNVKVNQIDTSFVSEKSYIS